MLLSELAYCNCNTLFGDKKKRPDIKQKHAQGARV